MLCFREQSRSMDWITSLKLPKRLAEWRLAIASTQPSGWRSGRWWWDALCRHCRRQARVRPAYSDTVRCQPRRQPSGKRWLSLPVAAVGIETCCYLWWITTLPSGCTSSFDRDCCYVSQATRFLNIWSRCWETPRHHSVIAAGQCGWTSRSCWSSTAWRASSDSQCSLTTSRLVATHCAATRLTTRIRYKAYD